MEIEDEKRHESNTRSGNKTTQKMRRFRRVGQRDLNRVYSGIRRIETRKSETSRRSERGSRVCNFQSFEEYKKTARYGKYTSTCRKDSEINPRLIFCIDKIDRGLIIHLRRVLEMDAIISTLGLEYGNRKEGSGGRYKEASPKLGHGIDGSRNPCRIHSSIRGFEKRESKTFSGSQLHSSEQNFQSDTRKEFFSRNGIDHNPRRNNTKNPINGFYSLDTYPRNGYLIFHNNPILNQNVDAPLCAHAV